MAYISINPNDNRELARFSTLATAAAIEKLSLANKAFEKWKTVSVDSRIEPVTEYAALLRKNKNKFAELITLEMGKRIVEARAEIDFCAEIAEFYANGAAKFLADTPMKVDDAEAYIQYTPLGVLLGVMPWNFPFYQVTRFAIPNLIAGNAVMLKHASNVPQCAQELEDALLTCGLPAGLYTNLFVSSDTVSTLIEDKRIRGVSLTGSEAAGAAVAANAGKHLKRSVLELGGNDAFIVLDDADIELAIRMAVRGRMVNTGQSCVAAKRFIVDKSLAESFVDGLKSAFENMKIGDPLSEDTDLGPLSTEKAATDLAAAVSKTVDAGATVVLGGDRPDREGAFFNPTILADVEQTMPSYDQELFGPVATVYVVEDEQEAINLANDSSYGLGGSVYTTDIERGRRVAEQIDTGMVFVNQPTNSQAELPFGGIKNSGYGKELSQLGIVEFVNKKLIHLGPK